MIQSGPFVYKRLGPGWQERIVCGRRGRARLGVRRYYPCMSWATLVTLLSGVLVGLVPNYLMERRKERHALRTRWDMSLYTLSVEFTSATQRFRRAVEHLKEAPEALDHRKIVHEERQRMSLLLTQLRLVANVRVQRAARMVIRHSYAVMKVEEGHEDPRAAEFDNVPATTRLNDSLHEFIRASRVQLRVEDPEHIAADEPSDWPDPAADRPLSLRTLAPWR